MVRNIAKGSGVYGLGNELLESKIWTQCCMTIYLFSIFPSLFSFSWGVQATENWKSNKCLRILPHGPLRWSRTAAFALYPVPVHVPGDLAWEPAHQPGCNLWPQLHTPTCRWLTLVSSPALSPKRLWTAESSPIMTAWLRCLFSSFLGVWMVLLLQHPMTSLWSSVTHCTTWSSWTYASVAS